MVDKKISQKEVGTFLKFLVAELEQGLDSLGAAQINEKTWPCRWIHMVGLNYAALDQLKDLLHLSDDVVDGAKMMKSRPDVSWCPAPRISPDEPDSPFDHLFVASQYIESESENGGRTDSESNIQLRVELENLTLKALRKRAIDEGQEEDAVEKMEDEMEDPKTALIDAIINNKPSNPNVFELRQVVFVCECIRDADVVVNRLCLPLWRDF